MGARIIRTAASAGALCGWLASCAARASAQESPGAGSGAVASGAGAGGAAEVGALSRLVVRIEDQWTFGLDGGARDAGSVLFEGGRARAPFTCGSGGGAEKAALDGDNIAVRKLELTRTPPISGASFLDGLRPLAGGWSTGNDQPSDRQEIFITNAQLRVLGTNGAESGLPTPVLHVGLGQPLPNGTTMEVPRYDAAPVSLNVEYDCWRDGRAVIELRLEVLGAANRRVGEACMQWTKVCTMGWHTLEVAHGNNVAFRSGAVDQGWEAMMNQEGTYETVTKFQLSSPGIERLRPPTVVSNQRLLKVEIRGELYFREGEEEAFEVTDRPITVSVLYTCESDGTAEVAMTLEKAVLSDAHRPERIVLKWRKVCGATAYRHLQIYLKGEVGKNATQAVSSGLVLPGFMRPCRRSGDPASPAGAAPAVPAGAAQDACEAGDLAFEVQPKDRRTNLELRVDKDASFEPPSLQPPPDLSYDRRIMQATLVQLPRTSISGKQQASRKLVQTLGVKYTCFKEGVSVVMVTLHVLAHKPIDLAWRKRCTEPKINVGKALTAPQAVLITILVCSTIAFVCCMIFLFCGKDDRSISDYDGVPNGSGGARDLELAGRRPEPSRLGMDSDKLGADDEEITYH